jgi:hypothetical protein
VHRPGGTRGLARNPAVFLDLEAHLLSQLVALSGADPKVAPTLLKDISLPV